jgi:hypothetical protein
MTVDSLPAVWEKNSAVLLAPLTKMRRDVLE